MKTLNRLALIAALGLFAGGVALAQPASDGNTQPQPPRDHPRPHRPDPEARKAMLLKKYDANHDGKLDDAEYAAIGKDVVDGKLMPPPGEGRPGGPGGPEAGPRHEELLKKYDVNHDGKLDETERAAIRKDIEDGKLEPPPHPHHGPGGPGGPGGFRPPPPGEDGPDGPPPHEQPAD